MKWRLRVAHSQGKSHQVWPWGTPSQRHWPPPCQPAILSCTKHVNLGTNSIACQHILRTASIKHHLRFNVLNDKLPTELVATPVPRQRSRYSDWLRAWRPRGRRSSPGWVKNSLFSTSFRPAMGPTQPPSQWVPGALSPRVKRQGREADHSPPASAEDKKTWIYTSTPPYAFKA
jgi:hypothetical protein